MELEEKVEHGGVLVAASEIPSQTEVHTVTGQELGIKESL